MSAPARTLPLLLAMLPSCVSWGVSLACPLLEVTEVVTTGDPVEFTRAPAPEARPLDEDWNEWLAALEVLRHGSREEKRALFDDLLYGDTPLYGIDLPPGEDDAETQRALDELAVLVAAEDDDWVVERIGASLVEGTFDGASVVFEALARHRVPRRSRGGHGVALGHRDRRGH